MPSTECEVLYGRCGFLHALLFARKYVGPSPGSSQLIKQLLQQIVEEGRRGAQELRGMDPTSKWELMWSWHGSYYLGGDCSVNQACNVFFNRASRQGLDCTEFVPTAYCGCSLPAVLSASLKAVSPTLNPKIYSC